MLPSWTRRPQPSGRRGLEAEWLEPRVLYSADLGAGWLPGAFAGDSAETRTLTETGEFSTTPAPASLVEAYATTALHFERNEGQDAAVVDFAARGSGYAVALTGGNAVIGLAGADAPVQLQLVGANGGLQAQGEGLLAARSNYLVGSDPSAWRTNIANYAAVRYDGAWDGVDVRYYGTQRQLEFDFIVAAGADASQVRMRFDGAQVSLDAEGNLVLRTAGGGELRFAAPVSWQDGPQGREAVQSAFVLHDDGSIGFGLGAYDGSRALVIDPVLRAASYFGESGTETATDVAVDAAGNVYVTGYTTSSSGLLGSLLGGLLGGLLGTGQDVYVAKFNADLSSLIYATRLGGSDDEQALAIAVDGAGSAVVTGWTRSSNFPTPNANDGTANGAQDAFVLKLNAAGDDFVFGTYYGDGGGSESGNAVTVDAAGNIYVAGAASGSGGTDAFVRKYDAAGVFQMERRIVGGAKDAAQDVAVDGSGNIYVAGNTDSNDLATTTNGVQTSDPGKKDGFLVRYSAAGTLTYGTYVGGDEDDFVSALAVDGSGRAYVVGQTHHSDTSDFATTAGALRTTRVGSLTGYLRVYDTNQAGTGFLVYSTFLGGSNTVGGKDGDLPTGVALAGDRVVVVSQTDSADMPLTAGALATTNAGKAMHIAVIRPEGNGAADLQWGSYYGSDLAPGFATVVPGTQRLVVAATTGTSGMATSGAYDTSRSGTDALVMVVDLNAAPVLAGAAPNPWPVVLEDSTAGAGTLVSALVAGQVTDADAAALGGIAITAADGTNGTWQYTLNGSTWSNVGTRSDSSALLLAADAQTRVRFVPAANFAGTAVLTFRAWDRTSGAAGGIASTAANGGTTAFSSASATSTLTVTPVNDAPVRTAGSVGVVNVSEGTTALGLGYGPGGGNDEAGQVLAFSVTTVPGATVGRIVLADGTTTVVAGGSYSLAQVQGMQFVAAPGITSGSGTFAFTVADGGGTANGGVDSLGQSLTLSVTNQAPVLNGANALASILEDSTGGNGFLVSDLIAGQVSDAGGQVGIAVFDENSPNGGKWQFSMDGGGSWSNLNPSVSPTRARLLAADGLTRVRYLPGADWNGNATLSFRAWDQSGGGTAGSVVDMLATGGSTPFSAASAVATLTVLPVNDAPVRTGTLGTRTVAEGSSGTLSLSTVGYGPGGGGFESGQVLSFTFGTLPAATFGTVMLADGTALVAGNSYTLADFHGLRFVAASGVSGGSATLAWTVRDDGGTANGGQDSLAQSLVIAIANQAPVLGGANGLASIAEDATGNNGTLVADIVAGRITDPSNVLGIAVTAASDPNGAWQYSRDGGASWSAFTGVGSTTAVLLAADGQNRIRFVPASNWNGTASGLTFRAWDQSGGTAGAGTGDTSVNGGSTPYSSATATASIVVTPVDDASVLAADTGTALEDNVASGNVLGNDSDVDNTLAVTSFVLAGDATVYTAGQAAVVTGMGSFTLAANGSYAFTPAANWNGNVPVVTYTTNTGSSSTLSITVTAVDDASVLGADSQAVDEDTAASGNVLSNDSDIDSTLSVASFTVAGNATVFTAGQASAIAGIGSITLAADGSYTFTPAANWNGSVPVVSYTTSTGSSSTLSITVTAVDDASVLVADSQTVDEDTGALGNVLLNDSDIDSTLSVASFTVAGNATVFTAGQTATIAGVGSLTLGTNGSYTFTPLANWNGTVPVLTYTTNTGSTSTLSLTVTAVDDASVLAADSKTVDEDKAASGNVLLNDIDVDSTLSVASFTVAGNATVFTAGQTATIAGVGALTLDADGSYTFTPAADWNGSVPLLAYTTNTGSTSTLSLTVTAVDDASVLVADSQAVDEDNAASGNVLLNDGDVDSTLAVASFTVAGNPTVFTAGQAATLTGVGTITLDANGSYTFTPLANWSGSVPVVSYTTNTGSTSTLALTLTPVDDASVLAPDSNTVDEDGNAIGNVLANDGDVDDTLTVATFTVAGNTTVFSAGQVATMAGVGTIALGANGGYTFTPAANWNGGVPVLTYTTNTGSSSSLSITVTPVDDASVLVADSQAVSEDSAAGGNVLLNDADVESLLSVASFTVAGNATVFTAGQTATITGVGAITLGADGSYTFTPVANWNGSVPVLTYTTNTGSASTLSITVTAVDDASVLAADSQAVDEDNAATGNVLLNDGDIDSALSVASFTVAGNATVFTAGQAAAVAGIGSITLAANGSYTFTPAANWNGSVPVVSYTTSTGSTSTLSITVTAVDDASVPVADARTVAEDNVASGNVLVNDADADDTLAVASFTVAGNATVFAAGQSATIGGVGTLMLAADGSYSFTPVADWNGSVPSVTYVTNTGAASTLSITVAAVDDASVLVTDAQTVDEDSSALGNVLLNDGDIDSTLSVASFTVAGYATVFSAGQTAAIAGVGTITLGANGSYTFTPLADWNGNAPVLTYTTNTGSSSTLALTVSAVDDASVPAADSRTVDEDNAAGGNVLLNDRDVDSTLAVASFTVAGDATVFTAGQTATIAGMGAITLGADGSYTFTPLADWNGSVPVLTYTTSTGSTSTLSITVTPVDDASVLVADSQAVNEDSAATGNVLVNDGDVDDILSVASFTLAGNATVFTAGQAATIDGIGSVTIAADGSYTFTPATDWNGAVPVITYTTSTGSSSTLSIVLRPVDDASMLAADNAAVDEDHGASGNVLANDRDVDNALTVAGFTVAGNATVFAAGQNATIAGAGNFTLRSDGSYLFTPLANWNGSVPLITYTTGTGASSTLSLTVNAVDDASVLAPDHQSAAEDSVAAGNVLANDADVDSSLALASFQVAGNATVFAAGQTATIAGVGTVTFAADGSYLFTPLANWNGSVPSITYTTSTGASSTLSLAITPVDDASVLRDDSQGIAEDGEARGNVLANDRDIDRVLAISSFTVAGDATVYGAGQVATIAGVGSLRIDADGSYVFTPMADWNGSVALVGYTTDTGASAGLRLVVTPVNDAPVASGSLAGGVAVDEGSGAVSLGLDRLGYGAGGGGDEATQALTARIDALPDRTVGLVLLADGSTEVVAGGNYTLGQLAGMRFLPADGSGDRVVDLRWTVRDDGGTADGGADSVRGRLQFTVGRASGGPGPITPAPVPAPAPSPVASPVALTPAPAASPEPAAAPVQRPGQRAPEATVGELLADSVRGGTPLVPTDAELPALQRQVVTTDGPRASMGLLVDRAGLELVSLRTSGEFHVKGFAIGGTVAGGGSLDDLPTALRSGKFVNELDRLRDNLREEFDLDKTVSISAAGLSLGMSVLYILWLVRGGVLVGSYLSALPAWRILDPLPVLARPGDEEDDEEDALDALATTPADPLRGFA